MRTLRNNKLTVSVRNDCRINGKDFFNLYESHSVNEKFVKKKIKQPKKNQKQKKKVTCKETNLNPLDQIPSLYVSISIIMLF